MTSMLLSSGASDEFSNQERLGTSACSRWGSVPVGHAPHGDYGCNNAYGMRQREGTPD